jgi:long-chain acyl-CoA synthetase
MNAGTGLGRQSISIYDGIFAAAARTPQKIAIRENLREMSYATLAERIVRVSNAARSLIPASGARAAVIMSNHIEYLEIVCGLAAAGIEVCTIAPSSSPAEIEYICGDASVELIFTDPALEENLRAAAPDVRHIVPVGSAYEDLLSAASSTEMPEPGDWENIFSIPYTSGSTGRPKGVLLSHRARVLSCYAMASEHGCYGPDDRAVATTPMFHGSGFLMTLAPVFFGGYVELLSNFDVERLMATIDRIGATSTFMIPSHFSALFAMGDKRFKYRRETLKSVIVGTAPLAQSMKERIIEYMGEGRLFERYGSTEAAIVSALRPPDQLRKESSVGLPICATRVQILDPEGNEIGPGEVGELYSTSPYMFSGYLNLPDLAEKAMRGNSFTAGDLARRDEEGYIYLIGRKHDMIISGGENIYPREIEEVLLAHPVIDQAAVIGMPHDYWGEEVVALLVLRDAMDVADDELRTICRRQMARYKVPKRFKRVGSLPLNRAGKIDRTALRDLAV